MTNKEPSFHERCELMKQAALDLVRISDLVHDEAVRMAAAEERFRARGQNDKRRA